MQFDMLLFERRDQVALLTLNRPDKLNALNLKLVDELRAAAEAIDADAGIRAVLLTGAGRGFCSGADLSGNDFLKDPKRTYGENIGANLRDHFNPMVAAWHDLRVPLVVAVNGIAAGAGMSIALLGDIVIAARSAIFQQLFAPKLGLMPDLGSTFFLPRLVGTARAKGLALLGDPLSAADRARLGTDLERRRGLSARGARADYSRTPGGRARVRRFAASKRHSIGSPRAPCMSNCGWRPALRLNSATAKILQKECSRSAPSGRPRSTAIELPRRVGWVSGPLVTRSSAGYRSSLLAAAAPADL